MGYSTRSAKEVAKSTEMSPVCPRVPWNRWHHLQHSRFSFPELNCCPQTVGQMLRHHVFGIHQYLVHKKRHNLQHIRCPLLQLSGSPQAVGQMLWDHIISPAGDLLDDGWHYLENQGLDLLQLCNGPQAVGQLLWVHGLQLLWEHFHQGWHQPGDVGNGTWQVRCGPEDVGTLTRPQLFAGDHAPNSAMQSRQHRALPICELQTPPSFPGRQAVICCGCMKLVENGAILGFLLRGSKRIKTSPTSRLQFLNLLLRIFKKFGKRKHKIW